MPKTVSARIENELHQELIDRCNQVGCRVSDFVKASIEFSLYGSVEFGRNWDEDGDGDEREPAVKPAEPSKQKQFPKIHYV